jgi:hypothetical protein
LSLTNAELMFKRAWARVRDTVDYKGRGGQLAGALSRISGRAQEAEGEVGSHETNRFGGDFGVCYRCGGDFGLSQGSEKSKGRDHHNTRSSMRMAGGRFKVGTVYG